MLCTRFRIAKNCCLNISYCDSFSKISLDHFNIHKIERHLAIRRRWYLSILLEIMGISFNLCCLEKFNIWTSLYLCYIQRTNTRRVFDIDSNSVYEFLTRFTTNTPAEEWIQSENLRSNGYIALPALVNHFNGLSYYIRFLLKSNILIKNSL